MWFCFPVCLLDHSDKLPDFLTVNVVDISADCGCSEVKHRGQERIELSTSCTRSRNHTPRPLTLHCRYRSEKKPLHCKLFDLRKLIAGESSPQSLGLESNSLTLRHAISVVLKVLNYNNKLAVATTAKRMTPTNNKNNKKISLARR
jgi:hypothetical protein